jgi:hypothetical protein
VLFFSNKISHYRKIKTAKKKIAKKWPKKENRQKMTEIKKTF